MTFTSQHLKLLFMDGRFNLILKKGDKIELDRFSNRTNESVIQMLKGTNIHFKSLIKRGRTETIILY